MNRQQLNNLITDNRQRLTEQIRLIQSQHLQHLDNQILKRQILIHKLKGLGEHEAT